MSNSLNVLIHFFTIYHSNFVLFTSFNKGIFFSMLLLLAEISITYSMLSVASCEHIVNFILPNCIF